MHKITRYRLTPKHVEYTTEQQGRDKI